MMINTEAIFLNGNVSKSCRTMLWYVKKVLLSGLSLPAAGQGLCANDCGCSNQSASRSTTHYPQTAVRSLDIDLKISSAKIDVYPVVGKYETEGKQV